MDRARQTPRDEALRYRPKKENSRIPFTVTYHPGLPDIEGMLRKLHPVLHSPQRFRDVIKEVPIVAFSQIYISIKKNSFLMVLFFYTTYIYVWICKHMATEISLIYPLTESCSGTCVFFFVLFLFFFS